MLLLVVHVLTAVVDEFVDIRWWQALVPFTSAYQRAVWLGLGALAVDLLVVVIVTSLLRTRMHHRAWRALHLTAYALWATSILHGGRHGHRPERRTVAAHRWPVRTAVPMAVAWRLPGRRLDRLHPHARPADRRRDDQPLRRIP